MSLELPVLDTSYKWNSRKWGFVSGSFTCMFLRLQQVPARHPLFLLHSIPPHGYSRSTQPLIKWWKLEFLPLLLAIMKIMKWKERGHLSAHHAAEQYVLLCGRRSEQRGRTPKASKHCLRQDENAFDRTEIQKGMGSISVKRNTDFSTLFNAALTEFILCYPFSDTSGTERTSHLYTGEPSYKSMVHRCNSLQVSFMRMSCYAGTKKLRL